uniref:Importin subunit alpha-1b-like n=1 Tax=Nicotiana tabacum TaxID=4097 RepID=A0A1S4D657_TOBAC|nr:PREDICTED: importin subunit alpha-1b-like [Nicotiana tabacum]
MPVGKLRSATVAVKIRKIRKTKRETPKRPVEAAWVLTSAFGGSSTLAIDHLLEPIFQKLYTNQDDSAWILVLIFSFHLTYIFDVVEYGMVEVLVKLLDSPDESLCEKAVLVVEDIVACNCDCVLNHGALTPLLKKLKEVTLAVCSLLELLRSDDDEVLTNVCCALSYCIGLHGIIQHHNNWDIYDRLHESRSVIIPFLKILVKIVDGKKFNPAYLDCLVMLLDNHNEDADVVTNICSIIYEIIECGNLEAVIAAGFIESLVNLLQTLKAGESDPYQVDKIIYVVAATINIVIANENDTQINFRYLVESSCIEVLLDVIASRCSKKFMRNNVAMVEKILEVGAKYVQSIKLCSPD